MYTKTWMPGTDKDLDSLFEMLRQTQYNDHSHKLWSNYSTSAFKDCSALTINFVDDKPFFCSSILKRTCWPDGVYRILNRLWKPAVRSTSLRRLSPGIGSMLHSQLDWLRSNTDFELAFVSRETDHWQQFCVDNFTKHFNLDFKIDNHKYLTCHNEKDNSCWQKILYYGNESLLDSWKRK